MHCLYHLNHTPPVRRRTGPYSQVSAKTVHTLHNPSRPGRYRGFICRIWLNFSLLFRSQALREAKQRGHRSLLMAFAGVPSLLHWSCTKRTGVFLTAHSSWSGFSLLSVLKGRLSDYLQTHHRTRVGKLWFSRFLSYVHISETSVRPVASTRN